MKFRIRLAVLFYEVVILFVVCFVALFVTHWIPIAQVHQAADIIYNEMEMRALFGLIAALLFIKTHLMAKTICGVHQRERNIAFDNPAGRVFVTLSALEDLIRRALAHLDEVKESRVAVRAKKGGELDVGTRLILNGDYNIPEMTSQIQKIIQRKIEKTIGSERKVNVEVDVIKILSRDHGKTKVKTSMAESQKDDSNVPFEGYRA